MIDRPDAGRTVTELSDGWRFHLGDLPIGQATAQGEPPGTWSDVVVPHDYSIGGAYGADHPSGRQGGFLPSGVGWYRRWVDVPAESAYDASRLMIDFDGVYANSDVYWGGVHLGHRPNGWVAFGYDLGDELRPGSTLLAVRVDTTQAPSARWYTGSGIIRPVSLTRTPAVRVARWSPWIRTPVVSAQQATVLIETMIDNGGTDSATVAVSHEILDPAGVRVAERTTSVVAGGAVGTPVEVELCIDHPQRWSPDTPQLYTLICTVGGDRVIRRFGVRDVELRPGSGLLINGGLVTLRGVCEHEMSAVVGAAMPSSIIERRLRQLKAMGCTAVRTGHHPFGSRFYALCDEIGLWVLTDLMDGWDRPKAPHDYGLHFDSWWRQDVADSVRRLRSHPSVIGWCIGNEVPKQSTQRAAEIVGQVRRHDPDRIITWARGRTTVDVPGFNGEAGQPGVLEDYHRAHPDGLVLITEEPHTLQTRGFYRTRTWWRDVGRPRFEIDDLTEVEVFSDGSRTYNSSYDNSGVRNSVRNAWRRTRDLPFVIGEFRWTGSDYLGESPGWPARMFNHGIIDLCGFAKDHYRLYQSMWTTEPMVHLLPHWTHPGRDGVIIPVIAYSNAHEVELLLDDVSVGVGRRPDEFHWRWDVAYRPGVLRAVARDAQGRIVAEKQVATAGTPAGLTLRARPVVSDRADVSEIEIAVVDGAGVFCPTATLPVAVVCEGAIRLLGLDNGDPLDLTSHTDPVRRTFSGLALAVLAPTQAATRPAAMTAATILGDAIFDSSTMINIVVSSMPGSAPGKACDDASIHYTVDGTEPALTSPEYAEPFPITETTTIRARSFAADGTTHWTLAATFTRGRPEPVVDLLHGDHRDGGHGEPVGPFDEVVTGAWRHDDQLIMLEAGGFVLRPSVYGAPVGVGRWWYDSPHDAFEFADDQGVGEIWWSDGTISPLRLEGTTAPNVLVVRVADRDVRFVAEGAPTGQA